MRRSGRWSSTLRALGLAVPVVMALAAPGAPATVIGRDEFTEPFSDDFELCGFAVHEEGVFHARTHDRVGKGDLTSAFFSHFNYDQRSTVTNSANGRFFTIQSNGIFHETKSEHVEGTVFRFTGVESGQPFTIRDASGRVVLRDRGAIRTTILFDTLGDDTPGGVLVEVESERVSGPHPGFDLDEAGFCAVITPLLS